MHLRILAFAIVLAGLAIPAAAEPAETFEELYPIIQRRFTEWSEKFVVVGDRMWSADVAQRLEELEERKPDAKELEAYKVKDAPLYFDPANEKRAQSELEMIERSLGYEAMRLRVNQITEEGILANSSDVFVEAPPELLGELAEGDSVVWFTVADGTYRYVTVLNRVRTIAKRAFVTGPELRHPEPEELFQYYREHELEHFPLWVPRLVKVKAARTLVTGRSGGFVTKAKTKRIPAEYEWQWQQRPVKVVLKAQH